MGAPVDASAASSGADKFEALLQCCDKLRLKLLPRARSLQILQSTGLVRFAHFCSHCACVQSIGCSH